jgi:hypothetical protein
LPMARSSVGSRAGWNGVPRALGNRSIICDPRRADMKGILNAKIKRREYSGRLRPQSWKKLCANGSRRMTRFPS